MLNLPENRIAVLDGAMGTMLQKKGLPLGKSPEALNLTHPEEIVSIHRAYAHAGAQILYANTFGANRRKLAGSGYEVRDVIAAGMRCVKEAARETGARAALCCGPIGALLEPNGSLHFDEAYDIFREVVTAGAEAGADLIVFETMTDLLEIKAALLAAKENTSLPVFCSMSFEPNGRTFTGVSPRHGHDARGAWRRCRGHQLLPRPGGDPAVCAGALRVDTPARVHQAERRPAEPQFR